MANSVDPDQTSHSSGIWSVSTPFVKTYLSQYLGFLLYILCVLGEIRKKKQKNGYLLSAFLSELWLFLHIIQVLYYINPKYLDRPA